MTKDEIKELLRGYQRAKSAYLLARMQLEECEVMLLGLGVDYSKERVQSMPQADKLGDIMDRLGRLRQIYLDTGVAAGDAMEATQGLVNGVRDPLLKEVLVRRYLVGQTWERIAVEMHYSWQHVHKLHSRALGELCDRMR